MIVEDGTGVVGADSYATVASADAYHLARGNAAWASATNTQKEAALINASAYLDAAYNFIGHRATTTQGLQWPRIVDAYSGGASAYQSPPNGWLPAGQWPPTGVINATYELALRALAGALAPDPVYDASGGTVTSTSIEVGPLKKAQVTSGGGQSAAWSMRKYPIVEALMRGYVVSKYNLIAERA